MNLDAFTLTYQISPIFLTGGIAGDLSGGGLPIISITQGADYESLTRPGAQVDLSRFFAQFMPAGGAAAIENEIGMYPFANQAVAANAIIRQPLKVSLLMTCTATAYGGGFAGRAATFANLQAQLAKHNNLGGTYTIATPALIYSNCVMLGMRDVSSGESKQAQLEWQLDFLQPLLTLEAAREAQNSLMKKVTNGAELAGDPPQWSGLQPSVGNPASGQAPTVVPAASGLGGASVGNS